MMFNITIIILSIISYTIYLDIFKFKDRIHYVQICISYYLFNAFIMSFQDLNINILSLLFIFEK